jgi:predicted  nucleic acid-binding Zn-ribbon protein
MRAHAREEDMTLKQLEKKIAAMEKRLTKLEARARRGMKTQSRRTTRSQTAPLTEREKQARILETLRARGLISEPTEREKQLAAEWNARPGEERRRIMETYRASAPNISLADIVMENRR